jgi:transposase
MVTDDGWRISDALWAQIEPLLPPPPSHRWGGHRPRVDNRRAMDAIFFVARTGCQWNALNATGICSSSSAHRRFQEWTEAGVFQRLWAAALVAYDAALGIEWLWQAMDGAMGKAPLGGKSDRAQSHGPWQRRRQTQRAHGRSGRPAGTRH